MPFLPYHQRKDLPAKPGIYYVGNGDYPVSYIGFSHNLRNRHINHHRQSEFAEIANAVIHYRVVTEDLLDRIYNLTENLRRLEKQAINYYQPQLNKKAVNTQHKLSLGGVYVQTHQVATAGYCSHFDAEDGEELAINTSASKISLINKAIANQRPIFLIASGNYDDYVRANYHNFSELIMLKNEKEKIYILISCFIPYGCEVNLSYELSHIVYGGNYKIFIEPYIILNNQPGFKEFKRSYLTVGFTNCEKSPFAQILLNLGGFQ